MTDHIGDPDGSRTGGEPAPDPGAAPRATVPDYELADSLVLSDPSQYGALFEPTRSDIVGLLLERAATTSDLAQALGKPKGTVGHHLMVLEEAGLVHVVRTQRVRALEAKYYGRTARVFYFHRIGEASDLAERTVAQVTADLDQVPAERRDEINANIRYVRIPAERAHEWSLRLNDLLGEFADQPRGGETTYALSFALYPTTRQPLPGDADDAAGSDVDRPEGAR